MRLRIEGYGSIIIQAAINHFVGCDFVNRSTQVGSGPIVLVPDPVSVIVENSFVGNAHSDVRAGTEKSSILFIPDESIPRGPEATGDQDRYRQLRPLRIPGRSSAGLNLLRGSHRRRAGCSCSSCASGLRPQITHQTLYELKGTLLPIIETPLTQFRRDDADRC